MKVRVYASNNKQRGICPDLCACPPVLFLPKQSFQLALAIDLL